MLNRASSCSNVFQQGQSQSPTPGPEAPADAQPRVVLLPESVENWERRIAELETERDQLQKKLLEIPEVSLQSPSSIHMN